MAGHAGGVQRVRRCCSRSGGCAVIRTQRSGRCHVRYEAFLMLLFAPAIVAMDLMSRYGVALWRR